jgi:hypothetical protein
MRHTVRIIQLRKNETYVVYNQYTSYLFYKFELWLGRHIETVKELT